MSALGHEHRISENAVSLKDHLCTIANHFMIPSYHINQYKLDNKDQKH